MSKVISFRLNPDNHREAEALTILDNWLSQGFSTRHTLTEALLNLYTRNCSAPKDDVLTDLSDQITSLLESIERGFPALESVSKVTLKTELSDGFVSSIIKTTKPGLKSDS